MLGSGSGLGNVRVRARDLPALAPILTRLVLLARGLPARRARAAQDVRALGGRVDEALSGTADLASVLDEFMAMGRTVATTHVAVSGASAVRLAILQRLLARWAPGDAQARTNRLMAGLDGVESAAPAVALEELAEAARERPDWRAFVCAPDAAAALARGEAPPELADRLRALLARFGHRALSEGELGARSWREVFSV